MKRVLAFVGPAGVDAGVRQGLSGFLDGAQEIILAPLGESVSHPVVGGGDVADLYASLRMSELPLRLARCEADVLEHVCRSWQPGDETVSLRLDGQTIAVERQGSAKPFGERADAMPPERTVWIGQGSNTWKSDLNLAVRYCRTAGRANVVGATLCIPWMAGIPGTVGGWIKMNAGAFGHSISEALVAVRIDGVWRAAEACGFSYRHSDITGEIQDFRLRPAEEIRSEGSCEFYLQRRRKFPARTFGSFFKNPQGDFAGRLLEAAGAKSLRVGGASVWSEHANVIVSDASASPSDVLALARLMMAAVFASAGLWLEPEVCGLTR